MGHDHAHGEVCTPCGGKKISTPMEGVSEGLKLLHGEPGLNAGMGFGQDGWAKRKAFFELIEHQLEDMGKNHPELKAEVEKAKNILAACEEHWTHTWEHHGGDSGAIARLNEIEQDLRKTSSTGTVAKKPAIDTLTDIESRLQSKWGLKVPGALTYPGVSRVKDLLNQVKDKWKERGAIGKGMSILGGTVSLGVVAHGGHNIKRGLVGYDNPETGEREKGSISNLLLGAGEMAAGLFLLKRTLTPSWGLGRAVNAKPHSHDHGHDHHHH
jgi:hypothetical protein